MRNLTVIFIFALTTTATPASGGSYLGTTFCTSVTGCDQGFPAFSEANGIPPFAITRPSTFVQAGGVLPVRVCVDSAATVLVDAVVWALTMWNQLEARTENCYRCGTIEESPLLDDPTLNPVLASIVLHELGHCAFGLDHPNRPWYNHGNDPEDPNDDYLPTSYTLSWNVQSPDPGTPGDNGGMSVGADQIRGSFDDSQLAPLGMLAESVSWFRTSDNSPVALDTEATDIENFSRSVSANLPAGHSWAANANRKVAATLGHATTQAVMYSGAYGLQIFNGLSPDDVRMVQMAQTGENLINDSGGGDDYTTPLSLVPCADPHEVRVRLLAMSPDGPLGKCTARVDYSFVQNPLLARHFELLPEQGHAALELEVNSDLAWEYLIPIFADSYESENTDAWSTVAARQPSVGNDD